MATLTRNFSLRKHGVLAALAIFAFARPAALSAQPDYYVIGPGKVRFVQSPSGEWTEIKLVRGAGGSLITGGGFAVFAVTEEGEVVELANTADETVRPIDAAVGLEKCHEGMPRGCRAPSLNPDDDGDGTADEDRLDGIDNDGDGAVDEDFAAIGDEMAVAAYAARGSGLEFHQEAYAWSLPNIDGAVMMSVHVKNAGEKPLRTVAFVSYYERAGRLDLYGKTIDAGSGDFGDGLAVISGDGRSPNLAMVAFPQSGGEASRWTCGYVMTREELRTAMREVLAADEQERDTQWAGEPTRVADGATVYCVSPSIDMLAPGEAFRVDLAIVVTPGGPRDDELTKAALETYLGDGDNRYIPPPVSIRPRVLWGEYGADTDGEPSVWISIDELGDKPVLPEDIAFVSGIEPSALETRRDVMGGSRLFLHRDSVKSIQTNDGRLTLKGRLNTGEFFELNLRPDEPLRTVPSKEVETYWKTPGKLPTELISSSPNPFRNSTTVFYEVPSQIEQDDGSILRSQGPRDVSVKIYNVSGRLVTVLSEDRLGPGTYSGEWAATDAIGNPVASGVYYARLRIDKRSTTNRLILLK